MRIRTILLLLAGFTACRELPLFAEPSLAVGQASPHWSFQPPRRFTIPPVQRHAWCHNAIDRFVLARLEREGLAPAAEADRITLLRRLSLDLIGLPPSPEEIDVFLADREPAAYERQVDRLLASPHYGEQQQTLASIWPVTPIRMASMSMRRALVALSRLGDPRPQP